MSPCPIPTRSWRDQVRLQLKMLQERLGFTAVYATAIQAGGRPGRDGWR